MLVGLKINLTYPYTCCHNRRQNFATLTTTKYWSDTVCEQMNVLMHVSCRIYLVCQPIILVEYEILNRVYWLVDQSGLSNSKSLNITENKSSVGLRLISVPVGSRLNRKWLYLAVMTGCLDRTLTSNISGFPSSRPPAPLGWLTQVVYMTVASCLYPCTVTMVCV